MAGILIHHLLERIAHSRPESILAVDRSERVTYGEIEEGANRTANVLADRGVRPGDRVVLIADNSRFYVEAYYGILKAGAIAVSLNAASDPKDHPETIGDCTARCAVLGANQARMAEQLAGECPKLEMLLAPFPDGEAPRSPASSCRISDLPSLQDEADPRPPGVDVADDARAAVVYTSGSTGRPRGAVLSHANIVANTRSIVEYLGITADDRVLVVLPFHYVYGKSLLNTHVAVGGSVVIENRFLYPRVALDTLEREQATGLSGVPSTFAILLGKTDLAERELPSLRYVTQAGGAMTPALTRRLMQALPGKRIFVMYGATEASARLSYLDPDQLPARIGSVGKAIPGVTLEILRDDGTVADPGETGEVVARGPNIMEGYWNDPEETALVLDEHGYRTGDLGKIDEDGFLHIVGRKREMIKSGAHRISPRKIEDVLADHPDVVEAAVVGIPDEILGEAIAAFVTVRDDSGLEPGMLIDWCRERLPQHMVPSGLRILARFPRIGAGKIDKRALSLSDPPDSAGRP